MTVDQPVPEHQAPTHDTGTSATGLAGKMGTAEIVFSVVAWAAPLLVVVGLMPSMIGFSGSGIVTGFIVTTLILLLFSVGYTAISRYVDRPGAFYAYVTAGLGKQVGLGAAFIATGGYALLVLTTWIAFGVYFRQLIHDTMGGPDIPWWVFALLGTAVVGVLAFRQIELSAKTLAVALVLEVAVVIIFDVAVFAKGGADGVSLAPFTPAAALSGNFGLAVLFAALCFIGFESSAIYREEAKNPDVTVPRATYVAVILIGVFYCVAAWALVTALGPQGVAGAASADVATLFADQTSVYVSRLMPDVINVLVITSTFACLLASHNAVARYGYSLGRDGVLPRRVGAAHPRFQSPYVASIVVTVLEVLTTVCIAAVTKFESAGTTAFVIYVRSNGVAAIAIVFLMCLVSLAIIVYFRRHPTDGNRAWQTSIAPTLGLLGLLTIMVLGLMNVSQLIGASTTVSLLLTLLLPCLFVAGVVMARRLRSTKPDVYAQIGRQ